MKSLTKYLAMAVTGVVLGTTALSNAQATWISGSMPDCNMDTVLGRATVNVTPPSTYTSSRIARLSDTPEVQFDNFRGAPLTTVYGTYLGQIFGTPTARVFGAALNVSEIRDRVLAATFGNGLKTECRTRFLMYYMGFPIDRPSASPIDDTAAHNRDTRNHSLYERTNDLEDQINLLRQDIRRLSEQLRLTGFQLTPEQTTVNTQAITTTPPAPVTNPLTTIIAPTTPAPSTDSKNGTLSSLEACTFACNTTRLSCMRAASSGKGLEECQVSEAMCVGSCAAAIR